MFKAIAAIVGVLAALVCLPLFVVGSADTANANTNLNTCTSSLQPVGNGTDGAGGAGPASQDGTTPVTIPLHPVGPQQSPAWTSDQIRNAGTITNVARTRNLAPRAAVIAVAVAMQESSLTNLTKATNFDSLGLFQQRPSEGWGSAAQVTDPVYASGKFYDHLIAVPDWQTIPLSQAAQDVQVSGFPGAYAKWEASAGALVSQAWGNAATSTYNGCTAGTADPTADLHPKSQANPRTSAQAIAAARAAIGTWTPARSGLCDNFVAQLYGWGSSGSNSAAVQWSRLVALGEANAGSATPPPGALLFYSDSNPYGHVDMYLGQDMVISTDVNGGGTIAIVHRADILHWLGSSGRYLGWAVPDFPSAAGASSIPLPASAKAAA